MLKYKKYCLLYFYLVRKDIFFVVYSQVVKGWYGGIKNTFSYCLLFIVVKGVGKGFSNV